MSAANYLAFTDGIYYEDFLIEQELKRLEFVYTDEIDYAEFLEEQALNRLEFAHKTRMDFLADVRKYFRHNHTIPDLQLQQRRTVVSLIKFLS